MELSKRPERNKCSSDQMRVMMRFIKKHPETDTVIFGPKHSELKEMRMRRWRELTVILNAMGRCQKSVDKWMKTWCDYKCSLKKKAAKRRETMIDEQQNDEEMSDTQEYEILQIGDTSTGSLGGEHSLANASLNESQCLSEKDQIVYLPQNGQVVYMPPKEVKSELKKATFDEEIIKIEKEKLELDKEYKSQKIEVLSRIASALEKIASNRDKT